MKKLIIVGTGQLSQDVRFFVERYNLFDIVGYAINKEYISENVYEGLPIHSIEDLEKEVDANDVYLYIAISWFHYLNRERRKAYELLKNKGFRFANLISPKAEILTEDIGEGNWICDFVYLDFKTQIGSNNVFRNYAYVGHYSQIGSHCFIGAKSLIGGNSSIGDQNFIGIASTVFNDVVTGDKCVVGGTAVVKKSLPDYSVCKISNSVIDIKQYTADEIEKKIMPLDKIKK